MEFAAATNCWVTRNERTDMTRICLGFVNDEAPWMDTGGARPNDNTGNVLMTGLHLLQQLAIHVEGRERSRRVRDGYRRKATRGQNRRIAHWQGPAPTQPGF